MCNPFQLEPGAHVCAFFESEDQLRLQLQQFLGAGLEQGEKVLCIQADAPPLVVQRWLREAGFDVEGALRQGQLEFFSPAETYLLHGCFDPDRMLGLLESETARALADGYPALRITGEASWSISEAPGSERFVEYEARANAFFAENPCAALCQYNLRQFGPEALLGALATHPQVALDAQVHEGLFYRPEAKRVASHLDGLILQQCLDTLRRHAGVKTDLATSAERLRQGASQKLEAVGLLAGGVAHELNNLLTVINGHADLALSDLALSESRGQPVGHHLERILAAGQRSAYLVGRLLAVGRRQMRRPEDLDLLSLLQGLTLRLQRLLGDDVQLVTESTSGLRGVRADRDQIEQVVVDLTTNAKDAMPNGGRLVFKLENVEVDPGHGDLAPGSYVELSAADTGRGMDEETCARIFEPFFTTKGVGEGLGLGLSTAYGVVKQSSGALSVESTPGQGTTIRILLPAVPGG